MFKARRAQLLLSFVALATSALLWLSAAPVAADARDEARILFEAGVTASRSDRWLEAAEYFQRSLSLSEKPSTWFNLAVAEVKLGHGTEALHALDAFEQMANPSDHAEMLERAIVLRSQAEELQRKQPPPAPPPSREVPPEPEVSEPAPRAVVAEPAPRREITPAPVQESSVPSGPKIMLGLGVAAGLGAVGAIVWWRDRVNAKESCDEQPARCTNGPQLEREQRTSGAVSLSLGLVSTALIAGGATWLVREKRSGQRPRAQLEFGPRAARIGLDWTF